jgi:YHS domain-containing protein
MLTDPVCRKHIKRQRAHIAIDYNGITYYLCCPRCQGDFERAPENFARAEWGEKTNESRLRHAKTQPRDDRKLTIVRGPIS